MKKALSVLLAALMLLFAGCASAKLLTAEEYAEQITVNFKEYAAAVKEIIPCLNISKLDVAQVEKSAANGEAALDKLEKLLPPKEYAVKHGELCAAITAERRWLDLVGDFCRLASKGDSITAQETEELKKVVKELSEATESSQFPQLVLEIIKAVKK